jgi:hypothetical protein
MRPVLKAFLLLLGLAVVIGGAGLLYFLNSGVSAKEQPGRVEEFVAGARAQHGHRATRKIADESGRVFRRDDC